MDYRPQLDGLRAFAVASVLCAHLAHVSPAISHLGVRLFFVLSGFLITAILLREGITASFYVRRAARLWPLLYAALAASLLLDLDGVRATAPWHLAQLTNLEIYRAWSWGEFWPLVHLWTLNVEEQFYLLWPFVIGLTPRRLLKPTLLAIVAMGPAYRYLTGFNEYAAVLPPASLDALAAGALLALGPSPRTVYVLAVAGAAVAVLGALNGARQVVEFAAVLPFCGLVLAGAQGKLQWIEHPWLVGVGRISYGVYVLHPIVWAVMIEAGWPVPKGALNLLAVSVVTLVVAQLSYRWFERPIRDYAAGRLAGRRNAPLKRA